MKRIGMLLLTLMALPSAAFGAGLEINEETLFEAKFNIDSMHTKDGQTYELSASGDAGPYGRVYLSYVMTNLQSVDGHGEFTGYAWTQSGEDIFTATEIFWMAASLSPSARESSNPFGEIVPSSLIVHSTAY